MENKFVCPKCGAKIRYWNEFFFYKKQIINPKTGQYGRTVCTEPQEHNCGDMHGLECTECDWFINVISDGCPDNFKILFE